MIKYLCNVLAKHDISNFIVSNELKNFFESKTGIKTAQYISDTRTLTFYALGKAQLSNKPCVIFIDEYELPNCYTGLMEAKFQKKALIVVMICRYQTEFDSSSIKEAIIREYSILSKDDITSDCFMLNGPILLKLYSSDVNAAENAKDLILKTDKTIFSYVNYNIKSKNVISFGTSYKYGILSKYFGYLSGGKDACLIAPIEALENDPNILMHYNSLGDIMPKILFITDKRKSDKYINWIISGGLDCTWKNSINNEDICLFIENDKRNVLMVSEVI